MSWLRLILLVGGLVLIAVLVWLERRRPSRVQQEEGLRGERSEPVFGFADSSAARTSAAPEQPAAEAAAMAMPARGPDPGRALPLIDWSTPVAPAPADPPLIGAAESPAEHTPAAAQGVDDPEATRSLRVEWPAEDQRQIVSLRIVASRQNRISGRLLRQGLSGAGFQHGEFGIFHLGDGEGRVALSAASLVRPGLLEPTAMDFQSFSGVNLFAVLPGPWSTEETLERMISVATELAQRVEGRVQDERGMPFDSAHPATWRERALAHIALRSSGDTQRPNASYGANAGQAD